MESMPVYFTKIKVLILELHINKSKLYLFVCDDALRCCLQFFFFFLGGGEGSGSVVESLTQDRGAAGSSLTCITALCP